jgi:hypothetical protein
MLPPVLTPIMPPVRYEFFGGPKDGDLHDIPASVFILYFLVRMGRNLSVSSAEVPEDTIDPLPVHVYQKAERVRLYRDRNGRLQQAKMIAFLYLGIRDR